MPDQIPTEARQLIHQFEREEAQRVAAKAAARNASSSKEIKIIPRRNVTARDVMAHAMNIGCTIETGSGKHGTHIKGPDGREISLPVHGKGSVLATGTALSTGVEPPKPVASPNPSLAKAGR